MTDIKKANVCYGCGLEWEHANEYNHLCNMCRYDHQIGKSLEEMEAKSRKTKGVKS